MTKKKMEKREDIMKRFEEYPTNFDNWVGAKARLEVLLDIRELLLNKVTKDT